METASLMTPLLYAYLSSFKKIRKYEFQSVPGATDKLKLPFVTVVPARTTVK